MPAVVWYSEQANFVGAQQRSLNEPLQIHIGCGRCRIKGYLNCDLYPSVATDLVFDCTKRWPLSDNSASTIISSHTLEHLVDFKGFFREAWRVLREDGNLQIKLPYGGHNSAWWDIEHQRPWHAETFCFLQPGYGDSIGNAQHTDWNHFFSIEDIALRLSARMVPILKWRLGRWLLLPWVDCLHNVIEELWVYLVPLKDSEKIAAWRALRPGNAVPGRYVVYRHHLEDRILGPDERPELVDWGYEQIWNGLHNWRKHRSWK